MGTATSVTALFNDIILPGFMVLAVAFTVMLLYSKYLERQNEKAQNYEDETLE